MANDKNFKVKNGLDVAGSLTADGLSYPAADGTINQILKTDGAGNLAFATPTTDHLSEGTNLFYTNARARLALSGTDNGGDGSFSYNDTTGEISYTGPSAAEVRAHFSAGTGVDITTGVVSIGQAVGTSDNVTFNDIIASGNLTVNGTTTTVSTTNTVVDDALIELGTGTTGVPVNDAGIVIERGDNDNAFIGYDESEDKFIVGTGTFTGASTGNLTITTGTLVANIEGTVTGAITGNADTASAWETSRTVTFATGDVTGSFSIDGSADVSNVNLTIENGSVTLAQMANIATASFIGRNTAATGVPEVLSATTARSILNVEDGADVTDTTNVTAAGALMDSELTSEASVKALNQGVATTDTPTFAGLTTTADVTFGDNDKAIFGAGSDLQIYHDGSNSYIQDTGTGDLFIDGNTNLVIRDQFGGTVKAEFITNGAVNLYHNNAQKLATTSTGIDVTGTVTASDVTLPVNGVLTFTGDVDTESTTLYNDGTDFFINANAGAVPADIRFQVATANSSDAFRVRNDGSLLANSTSNTIYDDTGVEGFTDNAYVFSPTGSRAMQVRSFENECLALNRMGSTTPQGDMVTLYKDGVKLASMGTESTNNFYFDNELGADIKFKVGGVTKVVYQSTEVDFNVPLRFNSGVGNTFMNVEGFTDDLFEVDFAVTDPTADRTITFKDETGTVALLTDVSTAQTAAEAYTDTREIAITTAYQSYADTKLPLAGGTMTGNIIMPALGTVDGVDISVRDAVLTTTTATANAALPKAGGTMTGNIIMPALGTVDGRDLSVDGTKLDGIEDNAKDDQTITAGSGLTGGGTGDVTISHSDTSAQASVNNSDGTVIQDITLDTYGHITGIASTNLDGRYYTETEADSRFVNVTGDTMTGDLIISKADAKIRLYDSTGTSGNNPFIEWDTTATQGIKMELNVYDGELPEAGYGLVVGPSTTNTQWPITGNLSFSVLGEIYTGSESLSTVNRVFHDGYHPNADAWTTSRTITLGGDLTGNVSINGSANVTLTATIAANSVALGTDTTGAYVADVVAGNAITLSETANNAEGNVVTVNHADTSTQASVNGSGRTYIQDITLDTYGHVTGLATATETVVNTNTTYSAGTGLDLSGTTFSIEPDLRDGITHVGLDAGDYIGFTNNASMNFFVNAAERVRIESDGDLHADGDVIAFSTTISDERLKKDIVKIEGALDKVCALNGYTFEYISDGKKSAGVIAQEVEKVLPNAVSEKTLPLKVGEDDTTEYKTVQYDQLHGLMIEAMKELRAENKELKARLDALEGK